ncbi:hypothetical protein V8D89_005246 [Ganoderma adspersum]
MLRILNPSIREFDILFPRADRNDLRCFGRGLAGFFSSMENLEVLSMQVSYPAPFLDIEPLPRLHPRLRHLKLRPGTHVELNHLRPLTALPNLEYLDIRLSARDPPNLRIALPGLRSLAVSCWNFDIIGTLLAHVDTPELRTFSLTEEHGYSTNISQELPGHIRALVTKCPSLAAFEWISSDRGYRGLSGVPLAELVAPLLSHRGMRRLSVSLGDNGPVVPYTPADFRTIAEAWPDLEAFRLHGREYRRDGSGGARAEQYADLESIVAFARHCPRLRSLHVPVVQFDPSDSDAVAEELVRRAQSPVSPHWLHELFVEHIHMTSGCSGERDGDRRRELSTVQFRGLMEKVFPSAIVRDQY